MGRLAILGLAGSVLGWERPRVVLGSLVEVGTLWAGALCSSRVRLVLQGQEQAGLVSRWPGLRRSPIPRFDLQPHPWQSWVEKRRRREETEATWWRKRRVQRREWSSQ